MNVHKKLVVGVSLFVLTLAICIPFTEQKVFAIEANKTQLERLAKNLEFKDANTIVGKIGNTEITFTKTSGGGGSISYIASNLDCNGDKAIVRRDTETTLTNNPGAEPGINLRAKYAEGNNCSDTQVITTNLTSETFSDNAGSSDEDGGGGPNDGNPECDTTFSNPLSWILCPVIELGANFTDFVFKNIISPLLSEVPISADSDDPGYKAWNQFRIIGNIVLVGTMIAVVYLQLRGDR